MAQPFKPPPLSTHEGPAEGFTPPPPVEDKPEVPIGEQPASFGGVLRTMAGQAGEALTGAGKGFMSTVFHAAQPLERMTGMEQRINRPEVQKGITPVGTPENIGYGAEKAAEFLAPSGLVSKGANAIQAATAGMKYAPIINVGGRAALDALSAAAVRGAQTGGDTEAMRNAGLTAGIGSAVAHGLPQILPNAERAGERIGQIREQLKDVPVNIDATAEPAIRAQQLANAKFYRPPVMREVLRRIAPGAEEPTFRETTDLGMNVGKLSVSERQALKGPMEAQIKTLAKALSEANQKAAEDAGLGDAYRQAMREYGHAKTLEGVKDAAIKTAKRVLIPAAIGASGYGLVRELEK